MLPHHLSRVCPQDDEHKPTHHTFTELPGEAYEVRVTARDHVGNVTTVERRTGRVTVNKYYFHGGRRVALRELNSRGEDVLTFLHGDHPSADSGQAWAPPA